MESQEGIINVAEFRRFAGKDADQFSDAQIRELILQLDFLAQQFVKSQRRNKEDKSAPVKDND